VYTEFAVERILNGVIDLSGSYNVWTFKWFLCSELKVICFPDYASVTENGFAVRNENDLSIEQAIHDTDRVDYYKGYTNALLEAINIDGVNVKGYFAWSEFIYQIMPSLLYR
jgi:hypothetical protein